MQGKELRYRIQNVYCAITRQDNPHGALAWFARQCRTYPQAVSRWVGGKVEPHGSVIALLECLEREAGIG